MQASMERWTVADDQDDLFGKAIGGRARAESMSPERRAEIAKKAADARWSAPKDESRPKTAKGLVLVEYTDEDRAPVALGYEPEAQKIWATQADIAQLFDTDVSGVSRHIKAIFADKELPEEGNLQKMQITGFKPTAGYSLDVIISVGYRVNSKAATKFRQWATQTLRTYLEQGYVINEKILRDSPEALNKLAAEVRSLRNSEKQVYAKVRECFKISASDYDANSQEVKTFYALLQDKFTYAITQSASSAVIMDRANHRDPNMGLHTVGGEMPTAAEVIVGKNYLREDELYRLHLLSEQFLLYSEASALAGRKMTMKSLHAQLDRLLEVNEYPIFEGYQGQYVRDMAERHAKAELALYKKRKKIESMGIEYDEEALAVGDYDHLLIEG